MIKKKAKKKDGRGGYRPGSGRKNTGKKLYSFRATKEAVALIEAQESKTDFINNCIMTATGQMAGLKKLGTVVAATEAQDLSLPFFDIGIVAGFPIPLDNDEKAQDINILRMLCPYPESCYLIRVEGESMIDAGIHNGDIVIVDKSNRTPSESEVAVCELNGEYTLKRFVKRDGEGWLIPANPEYPEIRVTENDTFSIWGTVTYIIHKARE